MTFDIAEYTATAHRVRTEDVAYDVFAERPLSGAALRCLRYMSDVESHTICYVCLAARQAGARVWASGGVLVASR